VKEETERLGMEKRRHVRALKRMWDEVRVSVFVVCSGVSRQSIVCMRWRGCGVWKCQCVHLCVAIMWQLRHRGRAPQQARAAEVSCEMGFRCGCERLCVTCFDLLRY